MTLVLKSVDITGMKYDTHVLLLSYERCILAKLHRALVNNHPGTKATTCCHALSSDVFGLLEETGPGGAKYLLGVIDHLSNYIRLLALPSKKAVVSTLSSVLTNIRILHSHLLLARTFRPIIKFDCDPSYLDVACRTMVSSLGYTAQLKAPYTHNHLAKMERLWPTLADSATAMLPHANCPTKYWGLAMRTAVYLRNRLPLLDASGVPYTLLHGVPTDLAHLKVFGCTAYLRLEDRYMDKLSPKALRYIFIGDDGSGNMILNLATGKLVRTIHVAFVESQHAHAPPTPSVTTRWHFSSLSVQWS
jgi:hypothetical protein